MRSELDSEKIEKFRKLQEFLYNVMQQEHDIGHPLNIYHHRITIEARTLCNLNVADGADAKHTFRRMIVESGKLKKELLAEGSTATGHPFLRLHKLIRSRCSISLLENYKRGSVKVIGKHFAKVMDCLNEIQNILGKQDLSDAEVAAYRETRKILQIIRKKKPEDSEITWCKDNYERVIGLFCRSTRGDKNAFNYQHMLRHIIDDMENWGSAAVFSGSSYEMMNAVAKTVIRRHTNKNTGEKLRETGLGNRRKDYLKQVAEHLILRMVFDIARGRKEARTVAEQEENGREQMVVLARRQAAQAEQEGNEAMDLDN